MNNDPILDKTPTNEATPLQQMSPTTVMSNTTRMKQPIFHDKNYEKQIARFAKFMKVKNTMNFSYKAKPKPDPIVPLLQRNMNMQNYIKAKLDRGLIKSPPMIETGEDSIRIQETQVFFPMQTTDQTTKN